MPNKEQIGNDGYRLQPYCFGPTFTAPCWAYEGSTGLQIYTPSGHVGTLSWATLEAMQRRHLVAKARAKANAVKPRYRKRRKVG